jgi:CheY-like chemotaxis protein
MTADHILIVDDDWGGARLVGTLLERQGYRVTIAGSGLEAIEVAPQIMPDLIILDVMMPRVDGYAVARELRAREATAGIPILMFSARGMADDRAAGFEVGADDFLTKPAHPAELLARVRSVLARGSEAAPAAQNPACIVAWVDAAVDATPAAAACAAALAAEGHATVLAAPREGSGDLCRALGISPPPPAFYPDALGPETLRGLLIAAGENLSVLPGLLDSGQREAFLQAGAVLGEAVLLDLDSAAGEVERWLAARADRVVIVGEASAQAMQAAGQTLAALREAGGGGRVSLLLVERQPLASALRYEAIRTELDVSHLGVVTAGPEEAGQYRTFAQELWQHLAHGRSE